ncbi:hypothetical protein R1sor_012092 [Riccia sorocarpa]|uniref:Ubiquitin-like protease family profile domain-containing protein n=1 Tax=Riccia sorocarpa TaxID=122646 RepID=A0ABD3I3P3_9MARC
MFAAPAQNPWITLPSPVKLSIKPREMVKGDLINTFMEETFSQLPPALTGSRYLSTYWLPRVENLDVGKPGFLVEMETAKKWILPSPVMDWAEVPYMFIPIHGYLHWSLMIVLFTITPSHRQVRLYHLDSHPGIHLPSIVGPPMDDKLGWKLATNEIKDLIKVADVKQLRNEILAKVTGA